MAELLGACRSLRLKFRYLMAIQKGRENWSRALTTARLSGHRNFTEQNRMPNAILRQAKAPPKSKCLTENEKFYVFPLG